MSVDAKQAKLQVPQKRLSATSLQAGRKLIREAFKESACVLIGAFLISGAVLWLGTLPFGGLSDTFKSIAYLFKHHAENARFSLVLLALLVATIPLIFASDEILESWFRKGAEHILHFLFHATVGGLGLALPFLFEGSSANLAVVIFWFCIGTLILFLSKGYVEQFKFTGKTELMIGKIGAIILFIVLLFFLPAADRISLFAASK